MTKAQGNCDPRFKSVEQLFQSYLDSGAELGAAFYVSIDRRPAIDLYGGHADAARTRAWDRSTITNVWSTTKIITALAAIVLIDRGQLDPDAPVATYWPEFGAAGKEGVLVRHILSHTSGVPSWDKQLLIEEICELPKSTALLAAQAPWWQPGTKSGYHAMNYGHLVGELVRRVTGKSLRQFVAEDVAAPLGVAADFQIGAAEKDWGHVAEIVPPPVIEVPVPLQADPESIAAKTFRSPPPDAGLANTALWRRAEIGAGNGHGSAKGVARMLEVVALGGEVGGVRLLKPETIERVLEEQVKGVDLVTGQAMRIGMGVGLNGTDALAGWLPRDEGLAFWGGWGGSFVLADTGRRMAIGYVMNKMENGAFGNERTRALVKAVYEALGVEI